MKQAIIHSLPGWQVISYGNGLAYEIANKRTAQSILFQGDDADVFRNSLEALTEPNNNGSYACILDYSNALACIWSDYSECASDWDVRD